MSSRKRWGFCPTFNSKRTQAPPPSPFPYHTDSIVYYILY